MTNIRDDARANDDPHENDAFDRLARKAGDEFRREASSDGVGRLVDKRRSQLRTHTRAEWLAGQPLAR